MGGTMMAILAPAGIAPPLHEGHGRADWQSSVLHYLLEPMHAIPIAIGLVCVSVLAAWLLRRGRRRAGTTP
jgi:hypothetical protein